MRKTVSIILFFQLLFAGSLMAQNARVSVRMDNVPVNKIMEEIEKQTNYLFIYSSQLNLANTVSVNSENMPVSDVLNSIFGNSDLTYSMEGNHIVVSRREAAVQQQQPARAAIITGVVRDENGESVIGAEVVEVGTSNGVLTDLDGKFAINIAQGRVMRISYLGYESQEFTIGAQTYFDVVLAESSQVMEGLVVTALGIKRSEKALSYNTQQVSADDINVVKDINIMNSLSGKVAGAVINSSAAGAGGASRVVLRGLKAIGTNSTNNALYVVDGIPLFNTNNGDIEGEYESQPGGEGITDLNPADIESMTVLSGPTAAALYGSSAANGVILITTKKGQAGKVQVMLSNQTTFSRPLMMYKFQNTYGNMPRIYTSWGAKLDTPSNYDPADFFNTAANVQSSASVSMGNEKNQSYISLMHAYANGIIPNNDYDKYSVTFRNTTSFLNDKMTLDAGFSYIETSDKNMLSGGRYFNPLSSLYTYPRGESLEDLLLFEIYDSSRDKKYYVQNWAWDLAGLDMQNPLWQMHRNVQENSRRRGMMHMNLTYKVTDWLTIAGRAKADLSMEDFSRKLYASTNTLFAGDVNGFFEFTKNENLHRYGDVIITTNNRFWCDFSLFTNIGASISDESTSVAGSRGPLEKPNVFSLTNTNPYGASGRRLQQRKRVQEQAVFASVELGWKDMLYLSVTARNEWSSTLAYTSSMKSGYFYPSVGLSGLIHEMVKLPEFISFLKVRGSWADVGSPIPWGISYLQREWKQGQWSPAAIRPPEDLKPEMTRSWEVGLNTRLFNNSLSIDFTYYKANTRNQTFKVPISATGGYEFMYAQAGEVENKGFELTVGYDKKWKDFAWSSSVTLSHNKNKVIELLDNFYDSATDEYYTLKEYEVASMGGAKFIMTAGGTMGDVYSNGALELDQNGYIYVNPLDNTIRRDDKVRVKLGSVLPDFNAGFRNDFSYKGVNLSVLLTGRFGGIVVSPTQGYLDGYGVSDTSAKARDAGGVRINNGMVDAQMYYTTVGSGTPMLSEYTYSATNIRLQELSIGYTFPAKWFNNKLVLSASLVGRNLFMIYCKAPFDPELTSSTGSYLTGVDYFMQPSLRSFGFNLNVKF